MDPKEQYCALVRCPHKKHYWVPLSVLLDPNVVAYGCGCPEGEDPRFKPPGPPASRRKIRRAAKQLRRDMEAFGL